MPLDELEFYRGYGPGDPASIRFAIEPIGDGGAPPEPVRSIAEWKRFIDAHLAPQNASKSATAIVRLAGIDALCVLPRTNQVPGELLTWNASYCFFWDRRAEWRKSTMCVIEMTAQKPETLWILTNSLRTLKVQVAAANAPLPGRPLHPLPSAAGLPPGSDQANTKLLVGTWQLSLPNGDPNMHLELRADGHWRWWNPAAQADPSGIIALQSGTWFVHGHVLFCRVDESGASAFPPGITFTFDIVSVSAQKAAMVWPDGKKRMSWDRVQ